MCKQTSGICLFFTQYYVVYSRLGAACSRAYNKTHTWGEYTRPYTVAIISCLASLIASGQTA